MEIRKKNVFGSEMDPEDIARQAMLRGNEPALVEQVAPTNSSPPPDVKLNGPTGPTGPKWWHFSQWKPFLYTQWFRYMLLFGVTCILLLMISPPFVQVRRKNQTHLEKAPTSYKRILIVSAVTTGMVVIAPMIYEHKSKIASAVGVVKNWF